MSLTFNSVTFDKDSYNIGDTVTLTVQYTTTDGVQGPSAVEHTAGINFAYPNAEVFNTTATFSVNDGAETTVPVTVDVGATDETSTTTFTFVSNTLDSWDIDTTTAVRTAVFTLVIAS